MYYDHIVRDFQYIYHCVSDSVDSGAEHFHKKTIHVAPWVLLLQNTLVGMATEPGGRECYRKSLELSLTELSGLRAAVCMDRRVYTRHSSIII